MALPSKYSPTNSEEKWYQYWLDNNYFHSVPDDRKPYVIAIPPPNVTGVLHMGHMLNNTLQDVLIRKARLQGYNACWIPGTDHASIATEAKVVAHLKEKGVKKSDITREEFLNYAWDWTHKHGGIILEQLKKLGCSCDWGRTKFTMDDDLSDSVISVFVDLYNKGLIYRGYRMVNWDPEAQTTLSDEEVIYIEKQGLLYHISYKIEGSNDTLTIATTRPETIFGDTAICVNPEDKRYQHLLGKNVIVPICNRKIPIIKDDYIDVEFGTGCLKVTPAHDINDKAIGERHNLKFINIFNKDATLNACGLHYEGKDRFKVRKEVTKELESIRALIKIENHNNRIGTSERTGAVIEPQLSEQWFLKMKDLSEPALKAVLEEEVNLVPKKFINTYKHWMENIHDWNISRQLWWGHRIPAYYYNDKDHIVAETIEEALILAQEKTGNKSLKQEDLRQDNDVLDTWFSSWLWPMSIFNGILNPENEDYKYYYPTNDLVTAPEILFFWVARMIMAGYHYEGKPPFKNIYLTGIVRDKKGRKMSKSLGNSPDPLELISKYGADGVRVGMLLSSPAGNDLMFDESLCKQGSGFANKIWNAYRLIDGWEVDDTKSQSASANLSLEWFENKFQKTLSTIEKYYESYRISDALMATYKIIWDDFCSWLLEIVKPPYGEPIDKQTQQKVISIFENLLKILHPFMPFLSEEIWQHIKNRNPEKALIVSKWPDKKPFNDKLLQNFERTIDVISNIRNIRKLNNMPNKEAIEISYIQNENLGIFDEVIMKLANISKIILINTALDNHISFRVKSNEYFIAASQDLDTEKETQKLKEELKYAQGFLKSVQSKLSNERFMANAPENVVVIEKQKKADALAKIATIQAALKKA